MRTRAYLGIDTSNYTTSAALFEPASGRMTGVRRLLQVREGSVGLKQSDAVFAHVKNLPELLVQAMEQAGNPVLAGVGVSVRPRDIEGSYMPCFLAGRLAACSAAQGAGVPMFSFSHQAGHIAAALFASGRLEWRKKPFLAFHVSGGTTECLLVEPDREGKLPFSIRRVAGSLDLKAGQAIDRVGVMLGLGFPAGPELDLLAQGCEKEIKVSPAMKGADCCLSGVENQCRRMLDTGAPPEEIAKYCICSIEAAVAGMTEAALEEYGPLPLLYSGGVMSNSRIQRNLGQKYGGVFVPAAYSSDNACGIAVLAASEGGEVLGGVAQL